MIPDQPSWQTRNRPERPSRARSAGPRAVAATAALTFAALAFATLAPPARACPVCDTTTGEQVRAGIFDGHFGQNLLLTLLPAPVFAALVAAIYFGPSGRSGGGLPTGKQEEDEP